MDWLARLAAGYILTHAKQGNDATEYQKISSHLRLLIVM